MTLGFSPDWVWLLLQLETGICNCLQCRGILWDTVWFYADDLKKIFLVQQTALMFWHHQVPSTCWCYVQSGDETFTHLPEEFCISVVLFYGAAPKAWGVLRRDFNIQVLVEALWSSWGLFSLLRRRTDVQVKWAVSGDSAPTGLLVFTWTDYCPPCDDSAGSQG